MTPEIQLQAIVVLFGLIAGSAVTALVWRVPRHIAWTRGRSQCPSCGATLGARDLVPVLSWVTSRGRCRHCGARVPVRYPLTELACLAWAVLLWRHTGPVPVYPLLAIWGFMLVALTLIDFDHQLLPDVLTLPGAALGFAAALVAGHGWLHAVLGMVVGGGMLWALAWGYEKVRKTEGMGGGDIKLAAMLGAVLGWEHTLLTLFLAAFAGSVWGLVLILRRRGGGQTALPFGTLLAPSALILLLWGADFTHWYFGLFDGR